MRIRIRIQIQGFDVQKLEKNLQLKKAYIFLIKNCNLIIPRPPKRTSKLQKSSILKRKYFKTFVGPFGPPRSGSGSVLPMQIQPTKMNAYPYTVLGSQPGTYSSMLPGNAGAQVPGRPGQDVHAQRLHLAQRLFHHLLLQKAQQTSPLSSQASAQ
jgi:hypothetical protein